MNKTRAAYAVEKIQKELLASGFKRTCIGRLMANARSYRHIQFKPEPRYAELQDPDYYQSQQVLDDMNRADWPLQDQQLIDFCRKLFIQLRKRHIPCYVHTAHRTPALQARLRAEGHSTLDDGPHQRGAALDIVHANYHWKAPDSFWQTIGQLGKEIIRANGYKITWGGDFKSLHDPAHWQLTSWRAKPRIAASAMFDQETGEVIEWKRSPFSDTPAEPMIAGENYISYLQRNGRTWRTAIDRKS